MEVVMSIRRRSSRLLAGLGLVMALFALGSFVVPAGCGGGDSKSKKKPRKKPKKGGKGSKGETSAPVDEELLAREMIKDQFGGVYTEFYGGKADYAALFKAMIAAEKALEKFEKTAWNDNFNTMVSGLYYARVDLAEWFLMKQKNVAFGNLEDLEAGKKALQEVADFLEPVDRAKIEKLKMGEGNYLDYPKFYDDAKAKIDEAFKELEIMSAIVVRIPPSGGSVNLCEADEALWEKEGDIDFTMASGELMLEAKGGSARVTSLHYFLKDFSLKFTFMITQGGFDIMLRALPGKGSPFFAGFNREDLPDPNAPFTMVLTVIGGTCTIRDSEGRDLCDTIETDRAPAGGGIGIKLRGKGASMMILEMLLEPK